jgi:hypothetical protein
MISDFPLRIVSLILCFLSNDARRQAAGIGQLF